MAQINVHARKISISVVSAGGWCFMVFALFDWAIGSRLHTMPNSITLLELLRFLGVTALLALALAVLAFASSHFFKRAGVEKFKGSFGDIVWGCGFGSAGVAVLLSYIFYFTTNMYGKIPAYIGGGAPIAVYVYLKERSNRALTADPILISGKYLLLTSTEHRIYLLSSDERKAIEISREIVEAMEYKPFSVSESGKSELK
jgi:hypothetical protein